MKALRTLSILIIFQIHSNDLFCQNKLFINQDSTKFFIGYDLLKGAIDESSITFGFNLTKRQFITISLGYTYDNAYLRGKSLFCGLSPSQDTYPFLAYQGLTLRTSYNIRLFSAFYMGFDFFYKDLSYHAMTFFDAYEDEGGVTFTRSENANVFGGHINLGWMINLSKRLYLNPSIGTGFTIKNRTYTTTDAEIDYNVPSEMRVPNGTYSKKLIYPSLLLNLNFGIKL